MRVVEFVVSCLFICTNRNGIVEKKRNVSWRNLFLCEKEKDVEKLFFFRRIEAKMEWKRDERWLLQRMTRDDDDGSAYGLSSSLSPPALFPFPLLLSFSLSLLFTDVRRHTHI
jgi:hypothetical protein